MADKKETKGWSAERRAAQAERCRANKPWEKSTGPKTEMGKKAVSMNALKHGAHSATFRALRKALMKSNARINVHRTLMHYAHLGLIYENKLKENRTKSKRSPPSPLKLTFKVKTLPGH